jgi:hypothetical protein
MIKDFLIPLIMAIVFTVISSIGFLLFLFQMKGIYE